jgi:hypothetical protein
MNDFSLPYLVAQRLLQEYYDAMIKQNGALAYQIATDFVEMGLKLQDIAGANKKV